MTGKFTTFFVQVRVPTPEPIGGIFQKFARKIETGFNCIFNAFFDP